MWNDIETTQDFLNFTIIANTVAELIAESNGEPISIGVSGSWGSGKSSMVKMIGEALKLKDSEKGDKDRSYVFLEFNAWLYQGYDDAKAALLQAVSDRLLEESKRRSDTRKDLADKVKRFISRINWLRVAKMVAPLSLGLIPGGVAVGGLAALLHAVNDLIKNQDESMMHTKVSAIHEAFENLNPEIKTLLRDNEPKTASQQIEMLRAEFSEILKELNITLIILVDDLDRCLPQTAISTLEAMRLLLFVERTAFIIAADEQMIRNSVKTHFRDIDLTEAHVNSYFDKLIQIPLSVPRLGVAEVKIYLVMLFADLVVRQSAVDESTWEKAKNDLLVLLLKSWQDGVPKSKIEEIFGKSWGSDMRKFIEMAEQLAGIMATAEPINGNPRLIKRFLNNLIIRDKIARLTGMSIDFASLVKMQLFERCASSRAFEFLIKKSKESQDGKLVFLQEIEAKLASGDDYEIEEPSWKEPFVEEWLRLDPKLGNTDIRPLLYLSRDRALKLAAYDELSKEARDILNALKDVDKIIIQELVEKIQRIGETEAEKVLVRLGRLGSANQWERQHLIAMSHVTEAFPNLGKTFVNILNQIPAQMRKPAFIPLLKDKPWASDMLEQWSSEVTTPQAVKNAIAEIKGGK